jgi:DNA modification methylase
MSILLQKQFVPINFKELMPELSKRNRATHHIHKYPAKLIPHIPNYLISKFSNEHDTVLDGFCGSGTTLLESILLNRNAIGMEINPVARLISKVKVTPLDVEELKIVSYRCYLDIKKSKKVPLPEFQNRDFWFSKKAQNDLAKIKHVIDNVDTNDDIRDFLLLCFSAIVKKVSNAEPRDISPRLSKQPNLTNVLNEFLRQLDFNIDRISEISNLKSKAQIIGDDVKKIDLRRRVDLIVTSPPYLAAMEYFRTTKLENFWLNDGAITKYRELTRKSIHGELFSAVDKELQYTQIPEVDDFIDNIYSKSSSYGLKTDKYFNDLQEIMTKFYKVLKPGGHCAIIVGNSKVLEQRVPLNEFLRSMGLKSGFDFKLEMLDEIKFHRLGVKRSNITNRIYNEHIVILKKP